MRRARVASAVASSTTRILVAGLAIATCAFAQESPPPTPTPAPPPDEHFFEEPPEKPKFSLRWDFLARYDNVAHIPYGESIQRGRFELRPEIDFDPWSDFRIGVRAIFDYGTEKYAYPYQDNYISRWASADRWYVLWTPGTFTLRAGRFGMPLAASPLFWDSDIQTPGIAASYTTPDGAWTLWGAGFYGPQHYSDQTRIAAGQLQWQHGDPSAFQIQASFAFWWFQPRELFEPYFRENTSTYVGGVPRFTTKFNVVDLFLRLRFPIGTVPMLITLDGFMNLSAPDPQKNAYEVAVVAGQVGTPGDFRGFYAYQYIERNATMGAYNTDDWWYHTWYDGHRVGVAWTFLPRLYLQGSYSVQRRLDVHDWVNRVLVDLVKMF